MQLKKFNFQSVYCVVLSGVIYLYYIWYFISFVPAVFTAGIGVTNTKTGMLMREMIGIEEVADIRIRSVTCPVMIAGRNRKSLDMGGVGMRTVEAGVDAGMTAETVAMRPTGPFPRQRTLSWNWSCSVAGIQESTSASMRIYLLKQPVTTSRVTLHLWVYVIFMNRYNKYQINFCWNLFLSHLFWHLLDIYEFAQNSFI